MPWLSLTAADVLAEFNDSEQQAYDTAKGDATGANLPQIVTSVIAELTQAITGRGITLGPAGTIPDGLKSPAIARARWRYLNALPAGKSLLSDSREKANQEFLDLLKLLRTDKTFYIEPGDGSFAVVMPSVRPRPRHFNHRTEDGIV